MGCMGQSKQNVRYSRYAGGAAVVEFALLLFLLLIIVAGIVEFGRAFWYYDALTKATRDAARYISMTRVSTTVAINTDVETNAVTMVKNAADTAQVPGFQETDVTVICDYDAGTGTGLDCSAAGYTPEYITVSTAYPVKIGEWIPFVTLMNAPWNVTLKSSTTMRYMCEESESC